MSAELRHDPCPANSCASRAAPAHAQKLSRQDWGRHRKGERVALFTLKGAGGLEARITNFGGRVVNLYVPDAHG